MLLLIEHCTKQDDNDYLTVEPGVLPKKILNQEPGKYY